VTDLLTAPAVVVAQRGKFVSKRAEYNLHLPDGTSLGTIRERPSLGGMFARKLSALTYVITDASGVEVGSIRKAGKLGRSHFEVLDPSGPVGTIRQTNLMFSPRFEVSTPTGTFTMSAPPVLAREWTLVDAQGTPSGRITRSFPRLASVFTSAEHFVVEIDPRLTGPTRLVLLAACVSLDFVRDDRKRRSE